ncbi:MAG: type I-C CRISPR-associated endonuclease Cas1 [Sterolibacterium sp.]|jgi:CRISPR-associated protein Cas1|nr:type I-C CRISPR-associated endonuclease Cas1 [Sterolibacterium sp.]
MTVLLNTLYVTLPQAWVSLDNDTIHFEVERQTRLRVPLHHIGSVVCLGNATFSTPLMHRLADEGIGLVFCNEHGRFKGRLEGPVSGNVLLRRAQHTHTDDSTFTLTLARHFVAGKIANSRRVLLRAAREAQAADEQQTLSRAADDLAAALRSLPAANSLDILRGIEGAAARQYFAGLNLVVRQDKRATFIMDGRSRRPPRDRMNALLSFLYSLLMNDSRGAIEAAGLDPQIGFLHALRPGRAALALDLMEELRPMAERLALTLINRGQINPNDFDLREGGGVLLNEKSRKTVLLAYQERKQETLAHPLFEQPVPLGLVPLVQARLLARTIRGEMAAYLPFPIR